MDVERHVVRYRSCLVFKLDVLFIFGSWCRIRLHWAPWIVRLEGLLWDNVIVILEITELKIFIGISEASSRGSLTLLGAWKLTRLLRLADVDLLNDVILSLRWQRMYLGCPMAMSGIVQSHSVTSFVTFVPLVHQVFDFLGELRLYLGSL